MTSFQYGYKADAPRSAVELDAIAWNIRTKLVPGLGPLDEFPAADVFHNLDQHTVSDSRGRKIPLDFHVEDLPVGVLGLTTYDPDKHAIVVALSTDSYRGLIRERTRPKFSFAHELIHAFAHTDQVVRLSAIPHRKAALQRGMGPSHPAYWDTEWQANAGGASILMPARGLRELERQSETGEIDVDDVRAYYCVSRQAAEVRLEKYGRFGR